MGPCGFSGWEACWNIVQQACLLGLSPPTSRHRTRYRSTAMVHETDDRHNMDCSKAASLKIFSFWYRPLSRPHDLSVSTSPVCARYTITELRLSHLHSFIFHSDTALWIQWPITISSVHAAVTFLWIWNFLKSLPSHPSMGTSPKHSPLKADWRHPHLAFSVFGTSTYIRCCLCMLLFSTVSPTIHVHDTSNRNDL